MVIAGSLNEPGTVTISGVPAIVDASNNFRGTVPTASGTNTFTIVAKDATGNTTTQQYELSVSGSSKTFTYDPNGNLSSDGSRDFEWDAQNRLIATETGNLRSEFYHDALNRRRRIVEIVNAVVQSDTRTIWSDARIAEERQSNGTSVIRKLFALGEEEFGIAARLFTKDHLGSLDKIKKIVKLSAYINCIESFSDHPTVVNAASNLLEKLSGEKGKHSRIAVGVESLPLGSTIEIDFIVSI